MSNPSGTARRPGRRQPGASTTTGSAVNGTTAAEAPAPSPAQGETIQVAGTAAPEHAQASRRGARSTGAGSSSGRRRSHSSSTPAALRRLGAVGLLSGTLIGAGSFAAVTVADANADEAAATSLAALDGARAAGAVARAEGDQAILTRTSTDASTRAAQRMMESMSAVVNGLSVANTGGDATLGAAAGATLSHPGLVEDARAQGTESAITALRENEQAWSGPIDRAVGAQRGQVDAAGTRQSLALIGGIAAGGLGTAALAGSAVWLARRTRRVVNPPLVGATVLGVAVLVGTVGALVSAETTTTQAAAATAAGTTNSTLLADAAALREAQLDGLLPTSAAGGGASSQQRDAVDAAMAKADGPAQSAWSTYLASYDRTTAAAGSNRAGAVTEATTTGAQAFQRLVETLGGTPAPAAASTATGSNIPGPLPWLLLAGGLGAGGLAVLGTARRLEEYR